MSDDRPWPPVAQVPAGAHRRSVRIVLVVLLLRIVSGAILRVFALFLALLMIPVMVVVTLYRCLVYGRPFGVPRQPRQSVPPPHRPTP